MLKRKLEQDAPNPAEIDAMSFRQLIREGAERGFIGNPEAWFVYRNQRNITSHAYDEKKAKSVHLTAVEFLPVAKELLMTLKQRSS
jgi:nucleotidyltransferase substrate binding protein (TIGR01987 family)